MPTFSVNADLSLKEIENLQRLVDETKKEIFELKEIFSEKDSKNEDDNSSESKTAENKRKDKALNKQVKELKKDLAILCKSLSQDCDCAPYAYYCGNCVYDIEHNTMEENLKNEVFC